MTAPSVVSCREDSTALRSTVATSCRILAHRGMVDGIIGHVSARVSADEIVIRCRGREEQGLGRSTAADVWRVNLEGAPIDVPDGYAPPNELPIHTELFRSRPGIGAVIHAHPPAAILASLAELPLRPVFGAYNIPALRIALTGVPTFPRPVLITRPELAWEMLDVMGDHDLCILRGHGITVAGATVETATTLAVALNVLLKTTVDLARLGARPPDLSIADLAELPDLGSQFNDALVWQSLVATLEPQEGG